MPIVKEVYIDREDKSLCTVLSIVGSHANVDYWNGPQAGRTLNVPLAQFDKFYEVAPDTVLERLAAFRIDSIRYELN